MWPVFFCFGIAHLSHTKYIYILFIFPCNGFITVTFNELVNIFYNVSLLMSTTVNIAITHITKALWGLQ